MPNGRVYYFSVFMMLVQCFFYKAWAGEPGQLIIKSSAPFSVFYSIEGRERPVFIKKNIAKDIEEVYRQIDLVDLDEDGVKEVVASFVGAYAAVNRCSKVYKYNSKSNSLFEVKFNGGLLCDYRKEGGFVISSYKDGGTWVEDVFSMENGVPVMKYRDSCIGCGEISRLSYGVHGGVVQYLVVDSQLLKDRESLYFEIISSRAAIFDRAEPASITKKYLVRGDRVLATAFDYFDKQIWIGFRFVGAVVTEGWIKCVDVVGCEGLVPVYKGR